MKRFLLKLSIYGTVFLLLANSIGWIGDRALKKSNFFKPSFLVNNFKVEDKLDYIILGSSRGLTTLNSIKIDKELDLNGINLSMDDTDLKTHLLMLKHFFNNGFKSEYCILTLDYSNFKKTQLKLGDNDYKFSPFIQENHVKEHFKAYETLALKPNYNSRFLPFIKYSYYNLQIVPASLISLIFPNKRHRFDEKGNYAYPVTQLTRFDTLKPSVQTAKIVNPLVDEVRKICEQNNSKLIIYIAPYQKLSIKLNASTDVVNHSGLTTSQEFFYDNQHVNSKGREFANQQFIKDVKKILDRTY